MDTDILLPNTWNVIRSTHKFNDFGTIRIGGTNNYKSDNIDNNKRRKISKDCNLPMQNVNNPTPQVSNKFFVKGVSSLYTSTENSCDIKYDFTDFMVDDIGCRDDENRMTEHKMDKFYANIDSFDENNDCLAEEEMEKYEGCKHLSQEEKMKIFPGSIHLDEIRKYQKSKKLLISKEEFMSFVGNILNASPSYAKHFEFEASSILTLQFAAESFLSDLFELCTLTAINAERNMINDQDIMLVLALWTKEKSLWLHKYKKERELCTKTNDLRIQCNDINNENNMFASY